jgi:hypothetical protein
MKKSSVLLIALFLVNGAMGQGCLPFGVEFATQSQIDNFPVIFPDCVRIGGPVKIQGNDITNLSALNQLNFLGSGLMIYSNFNLTNLSGLDNIDTIMGFLDIAGNPSLKSIAALNNLVYIGGLAFVENDSLASLAGLDNVTVIQGDLVFQQMNGLLTLSNLINLTSIHGDLEIYHNDSLTNLTGLDNIDADSIINLFIHDNYKLSNCAVQSICDYIVNPYGANLIQGNATGCSTIWEVEAGCATIGTESFSPLRELSITPNPAHTNISLSFPPPYSFSVLDLKGRHLMDREITDPVATVDVSFLPGGIYVVKVTGEKEVRVKKFVRQ